MINQRKTNAPNATRKELDCVAYMCPSYQEARGNALTDRSVDAVNYLCWHTTGVGIYKRVGKKFTLIIDGKREQIKEANATEAAVYVYQNIMKKYAAHFVIGLSGEIVQTARLLKKAQHVGTPKSWSKIFLNAPSWWMLARKPETPLPKDGASFNMMSVGIEFVSPARNGTFTAAQIESAKKIYDELTVWFKKPLHKLCHCLLRPDPYMVNGKLAGGRTLGGKPIDLTLAQQTQLHDVGLL